MIFNLQSFFLAEFAQQFLGENKRMLQTIDHIRDLKPEQFGPAMKAVEVTGHIRGAYGYISSRFYDPFHLSYIGFGIQHMLDHM